MVGDSFPKLVVGSREGQVEYRVEIAAKLGADAAVLETQVDGR